MGHADNSEVGLDAEQLDGKGHDHGSSLARSVIVRGSAYKMTRHFIVLNGWVHTLYSNSSSVEY